MPLIVIHSVPPLVWFAHHWTVIGNDGARHLFAGSQLISGQALENLNSRSGFNSGHGPGLPAVIGPSRASLLLDLKNEDSSLL
jgi:hypothetical protein